MRKMTKTVAVLAAMSAMTVASASLAFAATDNTAYSAIGKEAVAAGAASGEWKGSNVDGWTFTPTDGTKLKGTWAQIDSAWYYFDKDGIMAQEELMYLEGETYYFDSEGRMMANGWVGFDRDSDVLNEYDLVVDDNIADIKNKVFKNAEDAYETVWMYFNADGTAKDDEWYQADSGLWYRFDDVVMVCGDFDHEVGNAHYGFDENGAMLVGWARNYNDKNINAPNKDGKTWYYYDSNGKKFDVSDNNGYGWKKIDGNWYCFCEWTGSEGQYSVGTLITNAYFTNAKAASNGTGYNDWYYVDGNGAMATGVVTVPNNALVVGAFSVENAGNQGVAVDAQAAWTNTAKTNKAWDVYFDANGAAKADWKNDRYYAAANDGDIQVFDNDNFARTAYAAVTTAVTGGDKAITSSTAADEIKGALVKSAFINKSDKTYYVDSYGDKVKNSAIQVGYVVAKKTTANGKDTYSSSTNYTIYLTDTAATNAKAADEIVCKAFVVLDSKGIAYDDVDEGRTVTAGSKKYVATETAYIADAELFYYYNKN